MHLDALSKDSTFIFWRFKGFCLDIRFLISCNGAKISCGPEYGRKLAARVQSSYSQNGATSPSNTGVWLRWGDVSISGR